ncbi:MAG: High-affinity zinc uptake system binding-protein ZnuA precursor [Planctomycetota bacterium]
MSSTRIRLFPAISLLATLVFCSGGCQKSAVPENRTASSSTAVPAAVLVTHPVLLEAAAAITSGTSVTVDAAIPDPAASREWRPKSADVRRMQQAQLLVLNGASWEPWTTRVSLPSSRVVTTSQPIAAELIRIPDAVTHQHGPEGRHSHAGTVPATWLSPVLLEAQIEALAAALQQHYPADREQLARQAAAWKASLQQSKKLLQELRDASQTQRPFVIADSPLHLYLLRDLGWEALYLTGRESGALEPEQAAQLTDLATRSPNAPVRLFLINNERPADVDTFAATKTLTVVRLDLCLKPTSGRSTGERLSANLSQLKTSVTK